MSGDDVDYSSYAGGLTWPRSTEQLRDTTLSPESFQPITDPHVTESGLDLTHPAIAELAAVSRQAAELLDQRVQLIGRIRYDTSVAASAPTPAAATVPATVPAPSPAPVMSALPVAAAVTAAVTATVPPPPAVSSSGSGVRVLLLVTGIILVTITAIFFLTVAYLIADDETRAALTAGLALAILGVAWLLKRRLPGTAEGVAWLGLTVAAITALFTRSSGAFGSDSIDSLLFVGATMLLLGLLALGHRVLTGIRAGLIFSTVVLPLGVGSTVAGIVSVLDEDASATTLTWIIAVIVAASGLLRLRLPEAERVIARVLALTAGLVAAGLLPFGPTSSEAYGGVMPAVTLAVLFAVTVWAQGSLWRRIAAVALGLAVVATGFTIEALVDPEQGTGLDAWALYVSVAILVVLGVGRLLGTAGRDLSLLTLVPLGLAATVLVALPLTLAVESFIGLLATVSEPWTLRPSMPLHPEGMTSESTEALVALCCVSLAAVFGVVLARASRNWHVLPIILVLVTLLFASTLAQNLVGTVAMAGVVAVASLAGALFVRHRPSASALWSGFGLALVIIQVSAHASTALWPWAALTVLALLIATRLMLAGHVVASGVVSGIVTTLLLIDAAVLSQVAPGTVPEAIGTPADLLFWPLLLSIVGLALSLTIRAIPRRDALGIAGPTGLVLALGALLAPLLDVDLLLLLIAPTGAAIVAALLAVVPRPPAALHGLVASSVLAAAVVTAVLLPLTAADARWVPVLVASLVPVLVASSYESVLRGHRPARHLAWATLGIAVVALWTALIDSGVEVIEFYTVPIALALVTLAFAVAWAAPHTEVSVGRTVILGAGTAIGLVPSALASPDGPVIRPLVVIVLSLAVVAVALFGPALWRGIDLSLALSISGLLGVLVTSSAMVLDSPSGGSDPWFAAELWILPTLLAALLVGWRASGRLVIVARVALMLTVLLVVAFIVTAFLGAIFDRADDHLLVRVIEAVVVLSGLSVLAAVSSRPAFDRSVHLVANLGLGAIAIAVITMNPDIPLELVTVPLAAAMLTGGVLRLRRDDALHTWPALGPGLAILLLPSLAYDLGFDEQLLRRVIGLGLLAIVVIVVGVVRDWQAPFIAGTTVLIIHAVAQLWPWIVDVYTAVYWWVWLGIGGAILITLAATYESQLRTARRITGRIGAMR